MRNERSYQMKYFSSITVLLQNICGMFYDKEAIRFRTEGSYHSKSYKQLYDDCLYLANKLIHNKIQGQHVGILSKSSYEGFVALLGTAMSGNTVVVPDAQLTPKAFISLLDKTDTEILLYTEGNEEKAKDIFYNSNTVKQIINIRSLAEQEHFKRLTVPDVARKQETFIFFTSGTTGAGKAVVLTNEAVCHNICADVEHFFGEDGMETKDGNTSLIVLPISHSMFLVSAMLMLCKGIAVYLAEDLSHLQEDFKSVKPVILPAAPFLAEKLYENLQAYSNENPDLSCEQVLEQVTGGRLKQIICGSAKLATSLFTNLLEWGITVYEAYGMTEACPTITLNGKKHLKPGSVGTPIPGVTVKIIENEVCVSGKYLMKGYYKEPADTKKVLYDGFLHTGDLGYLDEEGFLFLTGRKSSLIILGNGENVSPEELEQLLNQKQYVTESLVYEHKGTLAADIYYKEWRNVPNELLWQMIRQNIADVNEELPLYKKIQICMIRKEPLLRNRLKKIIRTASSCSYLEEQKPQPDVTLSKTASWLITICQQEIHKKEISLTDNFFMIGGNSIHAAALSNWIQKEYQISCSVNDIFSHPELGSLAKLIDHRKSSTGSLDRGVLSIPKAEKKTYYSLSPAQRRVYYAELLEPESFAYHLNFALVFEQKMDIAQVEKAFRLLIQRHSSLRTEFVWNDRIPVQRIQEHVLPNLMYWEEPCHGKEPEDKQQLIVRLFHKGKQKICIEQAPLMRNALVKVSNTYYLLFDIHHLICDGTSIAILIHEFLEIYSGFEQVPRTHQYVDISEWTSRQNQEENLTFWKHELSGELPVLELPIAYPRPKVRSTKGDSVHLCLDKSQIEKILEFAHNNNVTNYMVLLSAAFILLWKYSGQEDIIIGSPVNGRQFPEWEKIIGMFVHTLPIRANVKKKQSYSDFLKAIKKTCLAVFAHQEFPADELADSLALHRNPSRNLYFDVAFVLHNELNSLHGIADKCEILQPPSDCALYDLTFELYERTNGLELTLEYSTALFSKETAESLLEHYVVILSSIIQNQTQPMEDITMTTKKDRERILRRNRTEANYDRTKTVIQLFEEQVLKTPDAIALKCGEETAAYQKLNAEANGIAYRLRTFPIGREERIPILCKRSVALVAGILGILKSGAAYVPLDPEYPKERIAYMLKKADARFLLVGDEIHIEVPQSIKVLSLTELLESGQKIVNPVRVNRVSDLMYVLFTSGSTGKPKGVMIEHQNFIGFMEGMKAATGIADYERAICLATVSFDLFGMECLLPLLNGMTVTLSQNRDDRVPDKIANMVEEDKIEVLQCTPSRLKLLLSSELFRHALRHVRWILVGGEVFPEELLQTLRQYPNLKIINGYGPTEVTVISSVQDLTGKDEIITIGKPLSNMHYYIFDEKGIMQPDGVKGELYIGGDNVGRGYLNEDELTVKHFITTENGERIYRSGDLACILSNGETMYLGRCDEQIKIRGYRVELGEIENTLLKIDGIKAAAVGVTYGDGNQEKELCAYYTSDRSMDKQLLRQEMEKVLTTYMIPKYYMQLSEMPLSPNGKIDRKKLPMPDSNSSVTTAYVKPETKEETFICHVFEEVTGTDKVGILDDFFILGGNSLSSVELAEKMKRKFSQYQITDVFTYHTPYELAAYLTGADMEELSSLRDTTNLQDIKTGVHKLPVTYPVITSFNHHAHILSILGCYDYAMEWIMINYIQLFCHKYTETSCLCDFYFSYPFEIRPADTCYWLSTQKINRNRIAYMDTDIVTFVKDSIDQSQYVHLMVNLNYLKPSLCYQKKDYPHDILIYGYDEERKLLFCSDFVFTKQHKYSFTEISYEDFKLAYYNFPFSFNYIDNVDHMKGNIHLYQIKQKEEVWSSFTPDGIIRSMKKYWNSDELEYIEMFEGHAYWTEKATGIKVYDLLNENLQAQMRSKAETIDIRPFHVIYDHKHIMNLRMEFLMKTDAGNRSLYHALKLEYEAMEKVAKEVSLYILEYNVHHTIPPLKKALSRLTNLKEKEQQALTCFFEELKKDKAYCSTK